jgi:hypothetical protein
VGTVVARRIQVFINPPQQVHSHPDVDEAIGFFNITFPRFVRPAEVLYRHSPI